MKRRVLLSLVPAVVASAIVAMPLSASSEGERHRLVVSERMQVTGPTSQAGTFVATGAINDAGSGTAEFAVDANGVLTGTHTLQGANGTLVIETRANISPFPPPNPPRAAAIGRWRLLSGTGEYEGFRGSGRIYATADFTTGQITIMRIGHVRPGSSRR